jgi:hypothetical protein
MEKQQYSCNACGQNFQSADELDRHNELAHPGMNKAPVQGNQGSNANPASAGNANPR